MKDMPVQSEDGDKDREEIPLNLYRVAPYYGGAVLLPGSMVWSG